MSLVPANLAHRLTATDDGLRRTSVIRDWKMGGAQMGEPVSHKPSTTLPGTVEKIIKPIDPSEREKAQISIEGGEDLYREIRVENTLKNEKGDDVTIKQGAQVDVTIEADKKDTTKKAS